MHDNDATPIEAIDYESLQQPAEQNLKRNVDNKFILWFSFAFLIFCALIVFLFLPKYVEEKHEAALSEQQIQDEILPVDEPTEPEPNLEPTVEAAEQFSAQELNALKIQAEGLLLQLIEKQKLLESKAVKQWGSEEFRIALTLGTSGDEYFRKQQYQQAIASYKDAVMVLNNLEEQIAPTLALHLDKGETALTQSEKAAAIQHFELAKAIDQNNIQAANGLKRASTIEKLYALLEKGGKLEAANRFKDAKNTYGEATKLDPLSTDAKAALNRVNKRLAQAEFTHLIYQGYAALKLRQYGDAKAAFNAAQKLSPNSNKPKKGLASIQQAVRNEKLSALTAEAQHFESVQDWTNAVKSYQQILALRPDFVSAQQALEHNKQRENILLRLNEHINNKLRLSSGSVASDAKQLLHEASLIEHPGSKIEQATINLKSLLIQASKPISITLKSDNQTDVAIYKVGKFGKFSSLEIELKPGKYTIVGSRSGFRDVRKIVTVLADMTDKTIQVICDEPI